MDNFRMEVTAEGDLSLHELIMLACRHNDPGDRIVGYWVVNNAMVLFWHKPDTSPPKEYDVQQGYTEFPVAFGPAGAIQFVQNWLAAVYRPHRPDIDGDVGLGYTVFTEDWGHIHNSPYAVVGVRPAWAMYGK